MIELANVSRWYGQVIGLNDVSCTITPGVTALLGMNGAGKSTILRLITGQIRPTTGKVTVLGEEPFANPNVYHKLGYCPEIDRFYEYMSGREFVYDLARLSGLNKARAHDRTDEMMQLVGMADRCDKPIQGYSKGMRQRIKLAQAMLHDPSIILLDEPLNGLDPVGRHEYIVMLKQLAEQGKTIIVSSHILFEVEQMTRNIMLLHRGRLLAWGDLSHIREMLDKYPHRIRIETQMQREIASLLAQAPYVLNLQFLRDGLDLEVSDTDQFYTDLPGICKMQNAVVTRLERPDNNLESIFQYLVEGVSR